MTKEKIVSQPACTRHPWIVRGVTILAVWTVMSSFLTRMDQGMSLHQLAGMTLAMLVFSLWGLWRHRGAEARREYLYLGASAVLMAAAMIWNIWYWVYFEITRVHSDIFRGVYCTFQSPFYAIPRLTPDTFFNGAALAALGLLGFFLYRARRGWSARGFFYGTLAVFLLWLALFSPSDGRMSAYHQDFYKAAAGFQGGGDLLRRYAETISRLPHRVGHYPPGPILLMVWERLYFPGIAQTAAVLASVLTLLALRGLARVLQGARGEADGAKDSSGILAAWLLMTSAPVLVFTGISGESVTMLLSALTVLCYGRALRQGRFWVAAGSGLGWALLNFFSFVSFIVLFFLAFYTLLLLIRRQVGWRTVMRVQLYAAVVTAVFYGGLDTFFHFDIVACFLDSVRHNAVLAGNRSYFDGPARFLFRSTGNLLAFLLMMGPAAALFFLEGWRKTRGQPAGHLFAWAVAGTLVFASVSGLFYLETERVWLFLVPLVLAVSAQGIFGADRRGLSGRSAFWVWMAGLHAVLLRVWLCF